MLRQGPVDKNDGKPCLWNLITSNAICDSNIKPCPLPRTGYQQTAEAKMGRKYEEVNVNFSWKDVLYNHLVSSAYTCRVYGKFIIIHLALKMLCPFHFHLAFIPCSHVKDSWKDPLAEHPMMCLQQRCAWFGALETGDKLQSQQL